MDRIKILRVWEESRACQFMFWPIKVYWDDYHVGGHPKTWPKNQNLKMIAFSLRRPFRIGIRNRLRSEHNPSLMIVLGYLRINIY